MVEHRWLRAIGPGVIALGAVVAIGSSTQAARDRPWTPLACDGGVGARVAAAGEARAATVADLGAVAVDAPRSDPRRGRRTGRPAPVDGHRRTQVRRGSSDSPAESFAAGPFGRLLLVGADDGVASRALHHRRRRPAAPRQSAEAADVIRRATIGPGGDASSRAASTGRRGPTSASGDGRSTDPGRRRAPWRRSPADGRFGPTWSTEFTLVARGRPARRPVVRRDGMPDARPRARRGGRPVRLIADPALGPARRRGRTSAS